MSSAPLNPCRRQPTREYFSELLDLGAQKTDPVHHILLAGHSPVLAGATEGADQIQQSPERGLRGPRLADLFVAEARGACVRSRLVHHPEDSLALHIGAHRNAEVDHQPKQLTLLEFALAALAMLPEEGHKPQVVLVREGRSLSLLAGGDLPARIEDADKALEGNHIRAPNGLQGGRDGRRAGRLAQRCPESRAEAPDYQLSGPNGIAIATLVNESPASHRNFVFPAMAHLTQELGETHRAVFVHVRLCEEEAHVPQARGVAEVAQHIQQLQVLDVPIAVVIELLEHRLELFSLAWRESAGVGAPTHIAHKGVEIQARIGFEPQLDEEVLDRAGQKRESDPAHDITELAWTNETTASHVGVVEVLLDFLHHGRMAAPAEDEELVEGDVRQLEGFGYARLFTPFGTSQVELVHESLHVGGGMEAKHEAQGGGELRQLHFGRGCRGRRVEDGPGERHLLSPEALRHPVAGQEAHESFEVDLAVLGEMGGRQGVADGLAERHHTK
mmetsp:Transcript_85445/g.238493  ORF Transcript_85445/g.238493 Transcript_85445/m.238493 type:complete len:502 (-) Transcript_85445:428-1933(-)